MKNTKQKKLILSKEDFETIRGYLRMALQKKTYGISEAEGLEAELKKAKLVDGSELPPDVIRLNSSVTIRDEKENRVMQLKLVTPDKADIRRRMISILSPIGTALIGFSQGQKVNWVVPAGKRTFSILEVNNSFG